MLYFRPKLYFIYVSAQVFGKARVLMQTHLLPASRLDPIYWE